MAGLLLLGIACLVVSGCARKSPLALVPWLLVAASTVVVTFLAANGIPKVQEGPGALTALGWIPVLIIWFCCAVFAAACWFTRPKCRLDSFAAGSTITITLAVYSVAAIVLLNDSQLWGYYDLKIVVEDWKLQPVQGVWVHSLRQRAEMNLFQTFLPDDVETSIQTDAQGEVLLRANTHQRLNILINSTFGNLGRNSKYRFVDCELERASSGASPLVISWSRRGKGDGENMHFYSSKLTAPSQASLTLYLPEVNGDDASLYPVTADSQTQ